MTPILCKTCGLDLQYDAELAQTVRDFFGLEAANVYCDACQADRVADMRQEKADNRARMALEAAQRFTPGEFADTDTGRLPSRAKAILDWPFSTGRGIVFYGQSRAGKSRAAFALVASRIADQTFPSAEWIRGSAIARMVEDSYSDEPREKDGARQQMRRLMRTPCLLIDDFDKLRPSPATIEFVFDLFCERTNLGLPIVITTQSTGEHLASMLATAKGSTAPAAIVQRIREYCEPCHVKAEILTQLEP